MASRILNIDLAYIGIHIYCSWNCINLKMLLQAQTTSNIYHDIRGTTLFLLLYAYVSSMVMSPKGDQ